MVLYHRKFEEHCFLVMATIISCLLCVKNYCKCFLDYLIPSSPQTYGVGAIIIPSLQARSTEITQSPVVGKGQSQDWNRVPLTHSSPLPSTLRVCLSHSTPSSLRCSPGVFHFCSLSTQPNIQYRCSKRGLNKSESVIGKKHVGWHGREMLEERNPYFKSPWCCQETEDKYQVVLMKMERKKM